MNIMECYVKQCCVIQRRRAFMRFLYGIAWWHFSATICQIIMLTSQIFMSYCQNLYVALSLIHLLENKSKKRVLPSKCHGITTK